MQPGTDQWGQPIAQETSMQDSVVGGDLHTGNVVHNHYHTVTPPPSPPSPTPPPSQIISGIPQAPQPEVEMGMPATSATTALVLSIASIFLGFLTGFGICLAIPGLIIANQALAITDQYPGHPDAGKANAAKIISWIVIGLTLTLIFLYGVFIVAFLANGGFFL